MGGEQTRDLTYVDDVVDAFLAAAATPACHAGSLISGRATCVATADRRRDGAGGGQWATFKIAEFPADRARIDIGSYYADDRALELQPAGQQM